jgi:sugar transferase (PEP-CTERM/EpsH1 system associated)
MEILFLTGNLPYPPTDGWKIRVFSLIRHLSRHHRVSLVSFMRTTEDSRAVEVLRKYCADLWVIPRDPRYSPWKLFLGLVGQTAFPLLNYRDQQMMDLLRGVLQKHHFDVIQVESLAMAQYCSEVSSSTVLDLHNIESLLIKRYALQETNLLKRAYAEVMWRKVAAYEREACKRFTHCLTCSEEDRRLVQGQAGVKRVSVIPNGVDLQSFVPVGPPAPPFNRLVFVGRMDYHANVDGVHWFSREILPQIRRKKPDVLFQIVGGYPTDSVKRLASPGEVEVTGFVEDVRPYLTEATAVVVPLRIGGGTRLKILESLAMGKAVISTTLGAEGIAAVDGREILLADGPTQFADRVIDVLDNSKLREALHNAGRELVEAQYSWASIGNRLEQVYESCL